MKTAITTVLQLCRKHNLGNNSDFTSAYTQPWFAATVSRRCYFRRCWGFPQGSGARGQACRAVPQARDEHASVARSQARCMPPKVTSSQATASLHQGTWLKGRTRRRAFRKEGKRCSVWDIVSKLANKPWAGCWLPSTPGSVYHWLGHGARGQHPSRQLRQRPAVLPQATIQSLCGSDPMAPDR